MWAFSSGPRCAELCRIPSATSRSRNAAAAYSLPRSLCEDQPAERPPAPQRDVEHGPSQARIAPLPERPAEHPPGPLIHDDCEGPPPGSDR